jgi:SEC-C motif/Aspartyl protease
MKPSQECRAFTTKYNGITNRILTEVHVTIAFDPQNQPPNLVHHTTQALWDTGATHSVITETTAKALNLTPTGQKVVHHAGGQGNYNTHVVNLFLPNKVAIVGVLVSECPDMGGFGAIIGMDIIAGGDLSISNHQGQTWVTFRYPSYGSVDYVEEFDSLTKGKTNPKVKPKPLMIPHPVASLPKVGRNDMCPCGSGRKYKKCHGSVV